MCNVGDAGGIGKVEVEVDEIFVTQWESQFLDPGQCGTGFASLGRLSEGQYTVLIFVNPGSGQTDHQTNTFNVE